MLYNLLYPLHETYASWLNVFRYQSFRAMLAFIITFIFVLLLQPWFIRKLKAIGLKGQPIRDDGPAQHAVKQGTPTMGGLVVIAGIVLSSLLMADLSNPFVWLLLAVTIAYAMLGFVDDWRKITKQNTKGVGGKAKLFWQWLFALSAGYALVLLDFPTSITLPFFKDFVIDLPVWAFMFFVGFVVVGTSNAVNLTDGLDGLAIGPVMTVATLYSLISYLVGHRSLAEYLQLTPITGMGEVSIILAAVVAAGLGFLWYNTFPAQIFMGDLGALSLGAALGFAAVLVKQEVLLVFAGIIFVLEAMSVIIQRYYYKLTKKRVFRMAPIHHHFELLGWAEPKIIVRFWIVSIVMAIVCLATLKLR
ncbi:MAG: phospho-N-acetylmuramoyl-pentapeptide-transferase [Bdellovibrionales bacterium]|nr:phospho-N-acetylmuramoyl-pentapeptide-transferase [Bdellovibrionales bacterium]